MGKKIRIDVTENGRKGGKARAKAMLPAARSDAARRAVTVRWDRARARALVAAKAAKAAKRKPGRGKAAA
jgi:hypothetical protein